MATAAEQLSVIRTSLDPAGYQAGAKAVTQANQQLVQSGEKVVQGQQYTERALQSSAKAVDRLKERVDPLFKAQQELARAQDTLNKALDKGLVSHQGVAAILAPLRQRVDQLTTANVQATNAFGVTARQAQQLAPQINDVATSLLGGASAFQVLTQQGGQITQALGGVGNTFRVLVGLVTPARAAIAGVTIAVAASVVAFENQQTRLATLRRELRGTQSDYAALATDLEQRSRAQSLLLPGSTLGETRQVQNRLGAVLPPEMRGEIEQLTQLTVDLSRSLDTDLSGALDRVTRAFRDPEQAVRDLTERGIRGFDEEFRRHIELLVLGGDRHRAFAEVMDRLRSTFGGAGQDVSDLDRAWNNARKGWESLTGAIATRLEGAGSNLIRWFGDARDGAARAQGAIEGFGRGALGAISPLLTPLLAVAENFERIARIAPQAGSLISGAAQAAMGSPQALIQYIRGGGQAATPAPAAVNVAPIDGATQASRLASGGSLAADDAAFRAMAEPIARVVAERLGVSVATVLGHWSLETRNGQSFAGRNNLGNMTALPGQDATSGGDTDAQGRAITQRFRNFGSLEEFGAAYESWVRRRAPGAVGAGDDAARYYAALQGGGYASAPHFVQAGSGASTRFSQPATSSAAYGPPAPSPSAAAPTSSQARIDSETMAMAGRASGPTTSLENLVTETARYFDLQQRVTAGSREWNVLEDAINRNRSAIAGMEAPTERYIRSLQEQAEAATSTDEVSRRLAETRQRTNEVSMQARGIEATEDEQRRAQALVLAEIAGRYREVGAERQREITGQREVAAAYLQSAAAGREAEARVQAVEEARRYAVPGTAEYARLTREITTALRDQARTRAEAQLAQQVAQQDTQLQLLREENRLVGVNVEERERQVAVMRERLRLEQQQPGLSTSDAGQIALRQTREMTAEQQAQRWNQEADNYGRQMGTAVSKYLYEGIVEGNFRGIKNLEQSLMQVAWQGLIAKPLENALASIMSGALGGSGSSPGMLQQIGTGATGAVTGAYNWLTSASTWSWLTGAVVAHSGASVGDLSPTRWFPSHAIANAPRYHSGRGPGASLAPRELLSVLTDDEVVLNRRQQMRAADRLGGGGRQQPVNMIFNVKDGPSLVRSKAQILRTFGGAMRGVQRNS